MLTETPASFHRILVVDDEKSIRELLHEFLSLSGYEVMLAEQGEKAVELGRATPPDVALVDYSLPGIHGLEVCRRLSQLAKNARFVLMTGWGDLEGNENQPFIDRVVAKPFDLKEVHKIIQELLSSAA